MKLSIIIVIFFVITMFSSISYSACRSSYVCDDWGNNCKYMDVCDNTLDLPSINVDPIPALPSMKLKPLPSMKLPPLGTTDCEYKQVNGQWQNVCW